MRWLEKFEAMGPWVPAFPTDQVRGLKAHGKTMGNLRIRSEISIFIRAFAGMTKNLPIFRDSLKSDSHPGIGAMSPTSSSLMLLTRSLTGAMVIVPV